MFTVLIIVAGVVFGTGYALVLRQCFRDRTYAIPLVALCVYLVWDVRNLLGYYHPWIPGLSAFSAAYCVGHAIAFFQVLAYGRSEFPGLSARGFYGMIVTCLALAALGVPALDGALHDTWGFATSQGSLVVTFACYPTMLYHRRSARGLSLPGGLLLVAGGVLGVGTFLAYAPSASGVRGTTLAWFTLIGAAGLGLMFLTTLFPLVRARRAGADSIPPARTAQGGPRPVAHPGGAR